MVAGGGVGYTVQEAKDQHDSDGPEELMAMEVQTLMSLPRLFSSL